MLNIKLQLPNQFASRHHPISFETCSVNLILNIKLLRGEGGKRFRLEGKKVKGRRVVKRMKGRGGSGEREGETGGGEWEGKTGKGKGGRGD
jgi:hypothetical protein